MHKRFSYNIYFVTFFWRLCNTVQSILPKQNEQSKQNKLELFGDVIGALSLFGLLFFSLIIVGIYQ